MQVRIKNFRSFDDTGYVDLKPITVLIGRNGSGKSSFLRTFPLLKQSVEERTKSPLLMYGRFVDFGSYSDITPNFNKDGAPYQLSFVLDGLLPVSSFYRGLHYFQSKKKVGELKFSLDFSEDKKKLLHISKMTITIYDCVVEIILNKEKSKVMEISINNEKVIDASDDVLYSDDGEFAFNFFTNIYSSVRLDSDKNEKIIRNISAKNIIQKKIITLITMYVHGRTEFDTKMSIIDAISIGSDKDMLEQMKRVKYPVSWGKSIKNWNTNNKTFQKLKNYTIIYNIFSNYLFRINDFLKETFSGIKYIAPLRATAERYYRIQQLAVNEVDPNGKNLPIFLDSLTDGQMADFEHWTLENFDFKVKIHKIEGHYSIKIVLKEGYEINLSDMGFGYSQILPILTQLWYSSSCFNLQNNRENMLSRRRRRVSSIPQIIAIEQPELHLHPEFQARFADALVKVVKYAKSIDINLILIIETHSDTIVNRLGDCVISGEIESKQINIVLFEKDSEKSPSTVTFSGYDKDGCLINWPLGFFQPEMKF